MALPASGSTPGVVTDGPLRLVPFSFWMPFSAMPLSGRHPQQRGGAGDSAAGGEAPSADPAGTTTEITRAAAETSPPGQAAALVGSGPAALLAALHQAMDEQLTALGHAGAEPLRWAITGSDPQRGLRLEGLGLSRACSGSGPSDAAAPTAESAQASPMSTPATDQACGAAPGDAMHPAADSGRGSPAITTAMDQP